jgi:outer membrane protein OmpA-like peptidoglycan-associated protein
MSPNRNLVGVFSLADDSQSQRSQRILFRALGVSSIILMLYTMSACTVTREYAGDGKRSREKSQEQAQRMEREQTQQMAQEREQAQRLAEEQSRQQLILWREKMQTATASLGEKLRFMTGSSDLSAEAREELRQLSTLLVQQPNEKLRLKGYTDSQGAPDVNQTLAQARVEAVRNELINQGVSSTQVEIFAEGESSPVATNRTAEGRAKNRRVEIEIMSPPSG